MRRTEQEPFAKGSWRQEIYTRVYPKLKVGPITTTDVRDAWLDVIREHRLEGRFVLDVRVRDFVVTGQRIGLLERVGYGTYRLGPLLEALWLNKLHDLCLGKHGLDPEDWDDFKREWNTFTKPERWQEPMGGYRAQQLYGEGKTPEQAAQILAEEEFWPQESTGDGGPPYDAATRTGMYDRDF